MQLQFLPDRVLIDGAALIMKRAIVGIYPTVPKSIPAREPFIGRTFSLAGTPARHVEYALDGQVFTVRGEQAPPFTVVMLEGGKSLYLQVDSRNVLRWMQGKCDGDHPGFPCDDPECWQR